MMNQVHVKRVNLVAVPVELPFEHGVCRVR